MSGTLILRGFSDTHWNLKALSAKLGESKVSEFSISTFGLNPKDEFNNFTMDVKPNPSMGPSKYIIMADVPYKPLPEYVTEHIIRSVERGGKLIVLGGLFTLQKGEFKGTAFERIFPVSIKDPFKEVTPLPEAKVFRFKGRNAVIYRPYKKGMVYVIPGNAVKDPTLPEIYQHFKF